MDKEIAREWVEELRKGDRKQARGALHVINEDGSESFCCLGVLEDILVRKGLEQRVFVAGDPEGIGAEKLDQYGYYGIDDSQLGNETGVLTKSAQAALGIEVGNPDVELADGDGVASLAELNDEGYTFEQIADLIEKTFVEEN